jgi:tRNA dimethylallyltransferase
MNMVSRETQKGLVAIVGPTASGKSTLAIEIAKRFNGEIVSADSRQVYRGMDIGTAKPTREEMGSVPHYLINIKNPDEDYTVAEYKRDAIAAIRTIAAKKKLPILVGGTGLYVKAVVDNLDIPAVKADPAQRKEIERELEEKGLDAVFKKLIALDPEAAYIVDPKNPRRIVRALEVALATGKPFTAQRKKNGPLFDALEVGINPPPETLREQINARIDRMMKDGLLVETQALVNKYGSDLPALDAIGYRELVRYLKGGISLEKAVEDIRLNTWHYAKRQITWFKKDHAVHWIQEPQEAFGLVESFLGKRG